MELKANQTLDVVEGVVKHIGEARTVDTKFGKKAKVATADFNSPGIGNIGLGLWNDDITRFRVGDKLRLKNVMVREFRGVFSLSVATKTNGGSIEVIA
jgi:ssDNA-binding replication factor A large subunit